ncbi:hypothetical protein CQW23_30168 [Capsicum baccatum]|uniref:Uncharacterized protein n=1 Tax=Capsicum baccatum TaxID=33114 RepID=A0A2G2VBD6_CAPBA|nr:hypothetical protein CQW23_30168 [Capsicum baccatum]
MNWLAVQYKQLTGSIPFTIFNISRIEFIAFTGSSLSGYLPNGLCDGLPILKGLYLSYNKLHDQMPTSLTNCSQLQILSLSDNEFDGPIHSAIGSLTNLQVLDLGTNHFTGIIPHLHITSSLQRLSMWDNNLSGFLPWEIGNLTNKQRLHLSGNKLIAQRMGEIFFFLKSQLELAKNLQMEQV